MPWDPMGHENTHDDLAALGELALLAAQGEGSTREAIEVGSWAGLTASVLCQVFGKVYCVDTWEGNQGDRLGAIASRLGPDACYKTFLSNMAEGDRLYNSIIPCRGASLLYASVWPRRASMIFIDADHQYAAVRADILAWRDHVLPGGILCGHDYGMFPGVTAAVNELIPKSDLRRAGRCIWWTMA